MKFPGKRLIVEYKNRRSHKTANSLWGDINLKEIAREVESDLSLPQKDEQISYKKTVLDFEKQAAEETQISLARIDEETHPLNAGSKIEGSPLVEVVPLNGNKSRTATVKRKRSTSHQIQPSRASTKHEDATYNSPGITRRSTTARAVKAKYDNVELRDAELIPTVGTQELSLLESTSSETYSQMRTTAGEFFKKRPLVDNRVLLPTAETTTEKVRHTQPLPEIPVAVIHAPLLIQDAELNALEVENTQLKLLLIEHLRSENARLEQMIIRASQAFNETDGSA
jgi:hypothetical protein